MKIQQSFLEKYRPKEEDEFVGNELIVERVLSQVKSGKMNNMILTGSAGIGKTSLAEYIGDNYLTSISDKVVINCSDKTGVDGVRNNIISVARLNPTGDIRLFILEESEQLSKSAQKAMKKVLEAPFDKNNRFIFISNDISKFIEPIKDRCRIYHYVPIQPKEMVPRLKHIQTEESIDISDELLEQLAEISNGSMRYPLIQLEEFKALNREIKGSDLKLQKGLKNIKKIFKKLKQRKIPDAKRLVLKMYEKGNDFTDIAKSFHDFTMLSIKNELNFKQKAKCLISIGDAERNVNLGCNEFIQISRMIADISLLLQNTS